jgi:hypothetical protein
MVNLLHLLAAIVAGLAAINLVAGVRDLGDQAFVFNRRIHRTVGVTESTVGFDFPFGQCLIPLYYENSNELVARDF